MAAQHVTRGLAALGLALALTGISGAPTLAAPPTDTVSNEATPSAAATASGAVEAADDDSCPTLELAANWSGDNARLIQDAIDKYGRCGWPDGNPPKVLPYAVFDWDNTVIKNDISDQTIFWMLRNDKILQPPGRNWHRTSRYMTVEGAVALRKACGKLAAPGEPLPTSTNVLCADEILSVRKTQETTDGQAAFYGENQRYMQAMYAWVSQIMQGYTPAEARAIATQAKDEALNAPIGATQQVGSSTETAWVRYYPEIRDLISTLKRAGIEPWIVSASPKEFADVWGPGVGVDAAHTIGITQVIRDGKLTGHLEGCGGLPNGSDAIMPYIDGKRCFINQTILGVKGARALSPMPASQRPVLAAGDATTDVSMVLDAVGVHVVLNRNKAELMCRAFDNADGLWAVNPMFINPLPKMEGTYPCSTTAYTDAAGNPAPVRRADGSVIPDQEDMVFGSTGPTVTPTPSTSGTPTTTVAPTTTATPTTSATATVTVTSTATSTTKPTATPSAPTTVPPPSGSLYTTPGYHHVNGRDWYTTCEPYSITSRCTTNIWATQITYGNGEFVRHDGWVFNNLTYLPSPRTAWKENPLGHDGSWTAVDGRRWRTECDTPVTGGNGCRSWIEARVAERTLTPAGTWRYSVATRWVFNNIVLFS